MTITSQSAVAVFPPNVCLANLQLLLILLWTVFSKMGQKSPPAKCWLGSG